MSNFEYDIIYGTDVRRLQVHDEVGEAEIAEIEKSNFDLLWLHGNKNNFERLNEADFSAATFKKLNVQTGKVLDISWLSNIASLETITIMGKTKEQVNFDKLINLKGCDLESSKATREIAYSSLQLESLALSRLDIPFSEFNKSLASSLKVFGCSGNGFKNLDGIEAFINLETICINNSTALVDISKLTTLQKLKKIQIEGVSNIENLAVLGELNSLEELYFECKALPSLKFLLPARNLKYIRLGSHTLIEDRDVEIALEFPCLQRMSFAKKQGYKYDAEQLGELIDAKIYKRDDLPVAAEQVAEHIKKIAALSPYGYFPPFQVAQQVLDSDLKSLGISGDYKWKPFTLDFEVYQQVKELSDLQIVDCPDNVTDVYSWQAWVSFIEKKIPYEEHLQFLLAEKDVELAFQKAKALNNHKLINKVNLEASKVFYAKDEFLKPYLHPEQ
ncbi:hypothetical protein ORJ04_21575 [Rheinheimera baltica]|uniref:Uncharacterized protein n=1 Tax=Rheinheimera baltica TaxID=67576 RepID=A0ABT9I6E9_9GAMM|nr:hypothetical protein [Rheinheimera baltica]MDP5138541.1 hypothetical protein [Rheinheimera baltica]MDP5148615.1 hypothetical protein [Rheinheimera baltica]